MDNTSKLNWWMPFTANKDFLHKPKLLKHAKGMYYYSDDNKKILDGTSGLWCVNAGHGNKKITSAIKQQIDDMAYCPAFQIGHTKAFELAEKISQLTPKSLNHVFFTNSGSEAVDSALKIALAYQKLRGKSSKTRLIGRERGYHGSGFGGISVGGISANRKHFMPLLNGVDHLPHTYDANYCFNKGLPPENMALANKLQDLVNLHDASTIAAVIVEPIAGSTGVILPPKGYLQRLRELCSKHDILLIFDEVITAWGRIGDAFAATHWGVTPDMIITAKGLTSGYIPMGAVIVKDEIHQTFMDSNKHGIEFFHGYTYSAHPVATAAALATLEVYLEENLFEKAKQLAQYWSDALHSLQELPDIIDIRSYGLIGAIEFASIANHPGKRASDVFNNAFFEQGLLVRVTGDILALSPPLILEKQHIDELLSKLTNAIKQTK